jgi:hypothetical protein
MALLGYPRGHRIDPETRYCMTVHERLMSEWILSLEPEHRTNRLATTAARKPGGSPGFSEMLKLLAASVVRRRNVPPSSKVLRQWPRSYVLG